MASARALQRCEVRIESMAEMYSIVSTVRLEPEPIPLRIKVVLFGERELYELLLRLDPEFGELFRIVADLSDDFSRDAAMEAQLAQVLATHARRAGLLPLQATALARLVDHGARLAGDSASSLPACRRWSTWPSRRSGGAQCRSIVDRWRAGGRQRRCAASAGGRLHERVQER
jgi:predicted ATP-dependent protease